MPRSARVVFEGIAHHVTARGNFRKGKEGGKNGDRLLFLPISNTLAAGRLCKMIETMSSEIDMSIPHGL
jgi:hypothetical protein